MKSIPFNVVSTDMSHAVDSDERKKKSGQRSDHRDRPRSVHGTSCCWHSCLPVSFPRRVIVDHVTDAPKFVKKNERVNACTCLETFYLSIPPSQFRSHKSVLDQRTWCRSERLLRARHVLRAVPGRTTPLIVRVFSIFFPNFSTNNWWFLRYNPPMTTFDTYLSR